MSPDVQITFRHLDPSPELVLQLQDEIRRLLRLCNEITDLSIAVDLPNHRHLKGDHYRVRITLALPGQLLVASRDPCAAAAHVDPHIAVADAFHTAQRLVSAKLRRRRSLRARRRRLTQAEMM